jgi:hypothetical protein
VKNKFTKKGGFYFRRSAKKKLFFFKQRKFTAEQKQNIEQKIPLRHRQRRRGLKRQNINFNEDRQGGGWG